MRSTEGDILEDVGVVDAPPAGAPAEEGVMSVVVDRSGAKIRSLPSIYLGPQLVFATRDISKLTAVFNEWIDAIEAAATKSIYTLRACRIGEHRGLYGRDLFAGSAFRRKLQRSGVEFDPTPFVTYEGGRFHSTAFGELRPDFMILGGGEDEEGIMETAGAMLPFVTISYRLGAVGKDELSRLVGTLRGVPALSAAEPMTLLEALRPAS